MKISNFSKIMLSAAMALAGNAVYKMLQNRTNCCTATSECAAGQTSCCEQEAIDQAPIAQADLQEIAPIQTAMMDDQYGNVDMDENTQQSPIDEEEDENDENGENKDGEDEDPDDIP